LGVVVFLAAASLLLQLPVIQTFLAGKATAFLAARTGGKISIAQVAIRLPDAVNLKGIYVEDLQNDTLLFAGTLKVNISLFALLKQKVLIDDVLLKEAVLNLHEDFRDSSYNFQFLVDALTGNASQVKDTTPGRWEFDIRAVELNNVRAAVNAPVTGFKVSGSIAEFSAKADRFDIQNREIDFDRLRLKNSNVSIALFSQDTALKKRVDTSVVKSLIPGIGWIFMAEEIDFQDIFLVFDDSGKDTLTQGLDFNHLRISNLDIQINDAVYQGNLVKAVIRNFSMTENNGLHLQKLEGDISIDTTEIILSKMKAQTNHSRIENSTAIRFSDFTSLRQLSKEVLVDADFNDSYFSAEDILLFAPQLAENKSFNLRAADSLYLDGKITGAIGDLQGEDFIFSLGEDAHAHLNFTAKGLPDIDKTRYTLNIQEFNATPEIISSITNKELPQQIKRLGKTSLQGKYQGTLHDMRFAGTVSTQLGNLTADLTARFNQEYSHASYEGILHLEGFHLGTLLADTSIGKFTLEAAVTGSGLTMDSLQAQLNATIKEAAYRNYNYTNIGVDGSLERKKFTGKVQMDDKNLQFDFSGLVDLNDSFPAFQFEASVDTLNPGALHLIEKEVGIHADIMADFRGLSIDRFEGHGTIRNIHVSSDSLRYSMDSLVAHAYYEGPENKVLEVKSPVINAKLSGDFNAADLPRLLINYVNDYFPISLAMDSSDRPPRLAIEPGRAAVPDQKFDVLITLSKPQKLVSMFVPQITMWDTACVVGSFDSKEKSLQLDAAVPGLEYDSIRIDTIHVIATGNKSDVRFTIEMKDTDYKGKTNIPIVSTTARLFNQSMDVSLQIGSDSSLRLGLGAHVVKEENLLRTRLTDSLIINNSKWSVPADNYIDYRPGYLVLHNVRIQKDRQQIRVNSQQKAAHAPVDIFFRDFQLRELSDIADYNKIKMDGSINGSFTLKDISGNPSFTSDLKVSDIIVNENPVGDLTLQASQQGSDVDLKLQVTGGENSLSISGKVSPASSTLELDMNMERLNLNVADPFLKDFISDSRGYLSSGMKITGKFSEPVVRGILSFHDVSTHVVYTNGRYAIGDNSIEIGTDRISVKRLLIFDEQGRTATIDGFLTHQNFSNIQLDLTLDTDEFQFMNTEETKNNFFYGRVVLAINGHVTGSPTLPSIDARASTKPGTKVFISPLTAEEKVKREDFVLFQSPPFYEENPDSLIARQQYQVNVTGVALNLAFELTPDAEMQIIIDPVAGDKLRCKGSANLVVDIPLAGIPQVAGAYVVDSGSYSFTYQRLLRREFAIRQGSRIDFSGNVMDARLNVIATHTANATTYELIASQAASLSSTEIAESKKRSPVDVVLTIKGQLSEPELSFDIQLPPEKSNVLSTAERRLAQLREEPSELNKQVFALLMFNSFMMEESTAAELGTAGENVVLRSVSGLVSNQLNRLANKVEDFEINLNLSSYKSKYETQAGSDVLTQVELDVSKQFLNERLEMTVGGNVNLENAVGAQTKGALTGITGDFTIEYKLTPSGRYLVKVFQTGDYDVLNQSNVYRTGVGVTFRESFRRLLKRKKEEKKNSSL